jgi:hypothetical protein
MESNSVFNDDVACYMCQQGVTISNQPHDSCH